MKTGRLLFASIHCYLDPSSGAALATRELLELLAARGWDCRALTCGILDYQRETSVDELLKVLELDGSARRLNAVARARRGRGGGRPDARRRPRHGDAHGLQPGRACAEPARRRAVPRPGRAGARPVPARRDADLRRARRQPGADADAPAPAARRSSSTCTTSATTTAAGSPTPRDDLAALTTHLDLQNAIHVGHSTGGGEVTHYLGRHGESRVAKAALISAVPPLMVKTDANPLGLPKEVFDGLQAQLAANRSQFYRDLPVGPFYGYNRPGAKASEAVIQNWWRQGMMGGAKAHYDGIVAFSQTDFTEDLKKITVPVLVMHSEDDQIVPYVAAGPLSARLLKNGTLKTYKDFPHGMPTTHAETINTDLLAFIKS